MDDLIEALNIFKKYVTPGTYGWNKPFHGWNDTLYVTCCKWSEISEEDRTRLEELDFFYSKECGSIISYRFGSS